MSFSTTKTRTVTILTTAALVGTLGACSSSSDSAGQSSEPLEVWSRSDAAAMLTYQNVLDAFTEKTGIEVNYQGIVEFDTQLQARASSKDLPDVLIQDAGSLGGYQSQGLITPIDRESIEGADQISDETWEQNIGVDGETYGIPWSRQAFATAVRKDWREKLGAEVPKNWEELSALANAFGTQDPDGNGQDDTYGMMVPGSSQRGYIGWWASSYIWQAGGDILASKGDGKYEAVVDSPETTEAVTWIRNQFCTPSNVVPGALNLTTSDANYFVEGTAGIYLTGPYNWGRFDDALGAETWEVIPMPAGSAGTTSLAEGENIYFGAGSDKADQQKELAEFLISPEAQQIAMTPDTTDAGAASVPVVRLPVNENVDVVEVTGDERWQIIADNYAEDSKAYEWAINFQPFRQALGEGINAIVSDCNSDIEAGLANIDEVMTNELRAQSILAE